MITDLIDYFPISYVNNSVANMFLDFIILTIYLIEKNIIIIIIIIIIQCFSIGYPWDKFYSWEISQKKHIRKFPDR